MVDNHSIEQVEERKTPRYIFVAEGLMMYLSRQRLKRLFDKLVKNFLIHCLHLISCYY